MNRVVEILMRRDGDTKEEAEKRIANVQHRIEKYAFDDEEATEIIMDELGLEPDYLFDIL